MAVKRIQILVVTALMVLALWWISRRQHVVVLRAHAMSTRSSQASSSATSAVNKSSRRQLHRVLCYGDSLTAGTTSLGYTEHPYAPHLQAGLEGGSNDNENLDVVVRHIGLPGWTTSGMKEALDDASIGLRSAVKRIQDPPLSLVILLAGTNDLGYGYTLDQITDNLLDLHRVVVSKDDCDIPRSIAIGIPPSGYQAVSEPARELAAQVNSNLEAACQKNPAMTYVPFPFHYERGGNNWDADGLHFSPQGYQKLGESLVPVVQKILQELG